jgi:hypothetical protein
MSNLWQSDSSWLPRVWRRVVGSCVRSEEWEIEVDYIVNPVGPQTLHFYPKCPQNCYVHFYFEPVFLSVNGKDWTKSTSKVLLWWLLIHQGYLVPNLPFRAITDGILVPQPGAGNRQPLPLFIISTDSLSGCHQYINGSLGFSDWHRSGEA